MAKTKKEKVIYTCSVTGKPMSRPDSDRAYYKNFLGYNCLEAAKKRCAFLLSSFDVVCVSLSGGKDSLVTLELMDTVRIEMGIEKKLTVLFYDQELFPDSHVEFLTDIYNSGRFDFHWVCAPINSQKYILGKNLRYIQWDITREFLRQPPPFAETYFTKAPILEFEVFSTYLYPQFLGKRVVVCTGMRAAESLNRQKAILKATNPEIPYLTPGKFKGLFDCKPIYDWSTKDIFKFFSDFDIKYAPVYDTQLWSNNQLRVATPFTNEGAKSLNKLRDGDPVFFDRLMTIFPEMLVQARYYDAIDKEAIIDRYGANEAGILKYIEDELSGRAQIKALKAVKDLFKARAVGMVSKNVTKSPLQLCCMYPLRYIFYSIINGSYKRNLQHLNYDKIEENLKRWAAGERF